jgi:sugar phosphate isomerase/epimerase
MAWDWDVVRCIDAWTRAGLSGIGVTIPQLEQAGRDRAVTELVASGLTVSNFDGLPLYELNEPAQLAARQKESLVYLDIAVELGADLVMAGISPRSRLPWDEAARHVIEQTIAFLPEVRSRNLRLAIEPVSPMRQDVSFINLAADAVEIVDRVNDPSFGFLFDTYHLWWQRGIEDLARQRADRVFYVQVSDHKPVTLRAQDRAMPGQGIIPLNRLLHALADGGYAGWWELEVISDQNDAMGIENALRTATGAIEEVWRSGS